MRTIKFNSKSGNIGINITMALGFSAVLKNLFH